MNLNCHPISGQYWAWLRRFETLLLVEKSDLKIMKRRQWAFMPTSITALVITINIIFQIAKKNIKYTFLNIIEQMIDHDQRMFLKIFHDPFIMKEVERCKDTQKNSSANNIAKITNKET